MICFIYVLFRFTSVKIYTQKSHRLADALSKRKPSFSSDMYAFTCILRCLLIYLPDNQQQYLPETMIETLASIQFSPELLKEFVSNSLSF